VLVDAVIQRFGGLALCNFTEGPPITEQKALGRKILIWRKWAQVNSGLVTLHNSGLVTLHPITT